MPFKANTFRVLIASPSDVSEEREIAVRAIQEWNDLNAADRRVVLLPVRWETHSAPEYGRRPQETINRQVVDACDLLIGIFWTRIGTHTGVADSGTIEEIERVANQGKKIMLYFSKSKFDPEALDLEQLAKLREFKKKTLPNALVESYSSPVEFKEKLAKQLDIQIRTELADLSEGEDSGPIGTDIVITFADEKKESIGPTMKLEFDRIEVENRDQIPDFKVSEPADRSESVTAILRGTTRPNPDYYRELVTKFQLQNMFRPFSFWLKNRGSIGARDVYLDLTISTTAGNLIIIKKNSLSSGQPSRMKSLHAYGLLGDQSAPNSIDSFISKAAPTWNVTFDVKALQPQRELVLEAEYLIGATETCEVEIVANIYADTLPKPSVQKLRISMQVKSYSFEVQEILKALTKDYVVPDDNLQVEQVKQKDKGTGIRRSKPG